MKKAAVIASALVACAVVSIHAQTPGKPGPARPRVAILDFDYATVQGDVSLIFGRNVDVGKGVTDLLVNYLVKDGSFSVIERKELDRIIAEQNFSNSNRADASSAAKIGKLLGVDAIIAGSITQFGNDTKNTGIGAVGGGLGRIGLGRVNQKESKAIVGLTARIINIDTAEILAVAEGKGESKRTSTSLAGAGANWSGFGAGSVDFGSSNFQSTIIGEAVKEAVESMSTSVLAGRSRVAARSVTVEGLVAAVLGKQLILNVGSRAGVRVGDTMVVQRVAQEIKDPATGKVIRRLSTDVGTVKVAEVDEASAVAEIVSGSDFKVSDSVKTAGN
jgi:curli biogenesis system outer membrane secretion channel CsgG